MITSSDSLCRERDAQSSGRSLLHTMSGTELSRVRTELHRRRIGEWRQEAESASRSKPLGRPGPRAGCGRTRFLSSTPDLTDLARVLHFPYFNSRFFDLEMAFFENAFRTNDIGICLVYRAAIVVVRVSRKHSRRPQCTATGASFGDNH
jgi:hypothetical protein